MINQNCTRLVTMINGKVLRVAGLLMGDIGIHNLLIHSKLFSSVGWRGS